MNRTLAYSIHTCSVDRSISMSCVSVTQPERRPCCAPLSVCKCPVVQSTAGAAQKSQNREWPSYGVSHSPLRLLYVSFGFAHQHRACQSVSVGNRNRSPALGSGSKVSQKSRNMTLWANFFLPAARYERGFALAWSQIRCILCVLRVTMGRRYAAGKSLNAPPLGTPDPVLSQE